ncbi:MAG: hemolysin III family protein [Cyclobacteriaceae bacterium]|nr:hemolysin III family protein [Cyclobacteriaceae bacterium]
MVAKRRTKQTITEEWFNTLSHGITMLTTIGGLVVLIVFGAKSDKDWSLFSALIYGISLVLLYTVSSLYHGIQHEKTKRFFNILDHCGIYLLIAGTYTPVLLISIGGNLGWIFFGIQWGLALFGILLKVLFIGRFHAISVIMYAFMGWIALFKAETLYIVLPTPAFWLLFSGGIAYTTGIIFYVIDTRMKLAHFIWHLFVMAGSLLHYLMMVMYVF